MKLALNDMLRGLEIDPAEVLVLRHRPTETQLNKVLPWLAVEKPHLYNAYQQTQGPRVEKAMQAAKYVASFLGREAGRALYVGLYEVKGSRSLTVKECERRSEIVELHHLGMREPDDVDDRRSILWFDLLLTPFYTEWMGKLVVEWPGRELSWWRWADRNDFQILAVHEESVLEAAMPEWDAIRLSWEELQVIPKRWKASLHEWRGIYLIFDSADGKGYVGSAYGDANILGRWETYAASGHGGNRLLKQRNPEKFSFTILQRVSPDLPKDEVIRIESSWKDRLHTRAPIGLNDN
jgi:hypothetical protein